VDEPGVFHRIPRIDDSRPAEVFAREVPAMLVRRELLSPESAEHIPDELVHIIDSGKGADI